MMLLTAAFCILISSLTIRFSVGINQALLKKIFGGFLIVLSLYYLFIQGRKEHKGLNASAKIACMVVSALCEGMFGIGGPLMVLYFLSDADTTEEYLGSIQLYFLVMDVYNSAFRFAAGVLNAAHLSMIGIGMFGIMLGGALAGRVVSRIRPQQLKKLIYVVLGVSGIINLL